MAQDLFHAAYPLARRAARVHSAKWRHVLRAAGHDQEDLEAVCVAEVWSKIQRFNPVKSSLRTFVEQVVTRKAISFLRRCRARKRTRPDADTTRISEISIEMAIAVRRAFGMLSPADQNLARMLLSWSPTDIATLCGISRTSVYRCIERIRATFKSAGIQNC